MNCTSESAAIIFSNAFSISQDQSRRTPRYATRTTRVCINDCPVELLVLIFKFVFTHSRVSTDVVFSDDSPSAYPTKWVDNRDLLSPSLFPFALALVCPTWRDILTTIPIFWSRIPIIIDANPTPLHVIQSYLEWSRDVPLDVTVFRKPGTFDEEDPDEKARVTAVMDLLAPHVPRCRMLEFDVICSSSLPAPCYEIHGRAAKLEILKLMCRLDDGGNDAYNRLPQKDFSCPVLRILAIDARNFWHSCMSNIRAFWTTNSMEISHFSESESEDSDFHTLYLPAVLQTIMEFGDLRSLTLRNIEFDLGEEYFGVLPISARSMTFEDVIDETISAIIRMTSTDFESLTLTRCSLDLLTDDMFNAQLTLNEIASDEDLTRFLTVWRGERLYVHNCSSFNDTLLTEMAHEDLETFDFGAPKMEALMISDCPNFSAEKLKEMLDIRIKVYDEYDEVTLVSQLKVTGSGPPISREVAQWFEANLDVFRWCTTLPDGRTCQNGVMLEVKEGD
jgi:hypothetical protein